MTTARNKNVIRRIRKQRQRSVEVTPELEDSLLEAADKPTSPLTKRDFDFIRKRVHALQGRAAP